MDFPLIEKLRLRIHQMWPVNTITYSGNKGYSVIKAEDLERALEKATVMYVSKWTDITPLGWSGSEEPTGNKHTHKGLLICMEELPKEPCKHEPELKMMGLKEIVELPFNAPLQFVCRKCLKKIKATEWVEEIRE